MANAGGYEGGSAQRAALAASGLAGRGFEKDRMDLLMGSDCDERWKEAHWHHPPMEEVNAQDADPDTIRVFLNGCFDLMHVGHFNALRQAKRSFYLQGYKKVILVAGIHGDSAIKGQKGPPLTTEEERNETVLSVKWVDEIVTGLPYVSMSVKMADALKVKFICHGDDLPVVKGGGGMYTDVIENQRFSLLKRTEGISTTNIIERLLRKSPTGGESPRKEASDMGHLLTTVDRLSQFAESSDPWKIKRKLSDAKKAVYVDGAFDLLHLGHVRMLQHAAQLGDFLLVGLHSDEAVMKARGAPVTLSLHERALAVLSMGVVDDVILAAPRRVTQDLLTSMNITVVACGMTRQLGEAYKDRYDLPRAQGVFTEINSGTDITHHVIADRFLSQRDIFKDRNAKLWEKEMQYVDSKEYVAEK